MKNHLSKITLNNNSNMALNPPISNDGQPLRLPNEHVYLETTGIDFQVTIESIGKFKGKGRMVITSKRIVLINDRGNKSDQLKSFDLPLVLLFKVKFEQPIFGFNYYTGMCKPLPESSLTSYPVFKIWFMYGGADAFLKCMSSALW